MAFSFGTPAPSTTPASKPPTFSFGAPSAGSAPTTTPSLFGNTQTPAGGAQTTPSLFGTASASSAAGTTGLFGTTPAAQTSTPGTSLFGTPGQTSTAPTTSLFGQPATSAAPASGSSLFGGAQAPQQSTTSLFGQKPQPNTSTSLFGGAGTTSGAGGGLFGSTSAAPSLFGQQQPASQATASQPAVTSAPLFGQSQSAATSSLFGSKPASSTSLFGSRPASTGLFGQSTTLSSSTPLPPAAHPPVPKLGDPYPPANSGNQQSIESRIQDIKSSWDSSDPKCRFQTYFYNEVLPPNTTNMYGRPPQGTDERAWQKAVRENPDPEKYVPAIAIGFPAVKQRIEHQQRLSDTHQQLLDDIHEHLAKLGRTHSLETSLRVLRAQQASVALGARLMKLVAKASPLVNAAGGSGSGGLSDSSLGGSSAGSSLSRKEEELRIELDRLSGLAERIKTRTNEMWSGVGSLKAAKAGSMSKSSTHAGTDGVEWAVVDEQGLKQVLDILSQQQAGLDHLTKTLDSARFDVDVMQKAFGLSSQA
ncbi:hypothetical protein OIV83_005104 [Microbotryomycetes sp. JL201]|nr:hypothetical protein OIV83_005104 [Microbotryomycetes sp. JL201]